MNPVLARTAPVAFAPPPAGAPVPPRRIMVMPAGAHARASERTRGSRAPLAAV